MRVSHLFHKKLCLTKPTLDITIPFLLGTVVSVLLLISSVGAEEECVHSRLWCYECDSSSESRCKDPFNETLSHQDPVLLKRCQGCCVKIVTHKGTVQEVIRRTCTSNLQINLFLVDHVCMKESEGKGVMCFCESEACNSVSSSRVWNILLVSLAIVSIFCGYSIF